MGAPKLDRLKAGVWEAFATTYSSPEEERDYGWPVAEMDGLIAEAKSQGAREMAEKIVVWLWDDYESPPCDSPLAAKSVANEIERRFLTPTAKGGRP